jgi:hypothetical protein
MKAVMSLGLKKLRKSEKLGPLKDLSFENSPILQPEIS